MNTSSGNRLSFIDALRGIAALMVVLFHAIEGKHILALQEKLPPFVISVLEHGFLGVPIFFVLSGFVIAMSLDGKVLNAGNSVRFILRRSVRLDPPYWAAIVIAIGFSLIANEVVAGRHKDGFSLSQIVAHLFYVQGILGYENIITVFWTLCLEIQFYIVFVVLLASSRRASIVVLAGFVSLLWPFQLAPIVHAGLFLQYWYAFLLGAVTFYAVVGKCPRSVLIGMAGLVFCAGLIHRNDFAITTSILSVVILTVGARDRLRDSLDWRWLQGLGAISYSLYLIHDPVTGATFRIGAFLTEPSAIWDAIWWLISLAACIIGATLMWKLVEVPSMKLARRIHLDSVGATSAATPMLAEKSRI
jgi:peptidoglycan/LPS O-acetylase OafA/YrhL